MQPWQASLQCPPALAALSLSTGHQGGAEPRTCSHHQWRLGMVVAAHAVGHAQAMSGARGQAVEEACM